MTNCENVCKGLKRVAWGYFFLYFNFNLFTVNLLPGFVGYILFLSAVTLMRDEERELSLLYTLGVIMALWTGAEWLVGLVGLKIDGLWQFADIIISITNLYFHFQLLTNLASIAEKYQTDERSFDKTLLRYRTFQTVMLTVVYVIQFFSPWMSEVWTVISVCMAIVYIIAGVLVMKTLLDLRRCLQDQIEKE
ncbi:MAG: hypothetical protein IJO81_05345 [Clostridia bacterium]|nr:hypothetical protein [Clostridia bacterium]